MLVAADGERGASVVSVSPIVTMMPNFAQISITMPTLAECWPPFVFLSKHAKTRGPFHVDLDILEVAGQQTRRVTPTLNVAIDR